MKKLIAVVAVLSFAIGLNAAVSKEDIYNSNPAGFDKVKLELQSLNKAQSIQAKKAFQKEQINKAIKTLLSNKEVLNNANYAVIKNGKIVKSSKANEEDGINFWHEHAAGVENAPAPYTCHIYEPSWENINYNTPCGVLKYQMAPTSPYANIDSITARIILVEDSQVNVDNIEDVTSQDIAFSASDFVENIHYPTDHDESLTQQFKNFQQVEDIIPFAGYLTDYPAVRLYKPVGENSYDIQNAELFNNAYKATEYSHEGYPIKTLKSGSYIELLSVYYNATENWWDGYIFVFKWFRVNVENFYGTGLDNHNQNDLAKIVFDNHQITLTLDEAVNPLQTTYELYDISGKLIDRKGLLSSETKIAMPKVASGTYIVRVKGKNLNLSKKIVFVK